MRGINFRYYRLMSTGLTGDWWLLRWHRTSLWEKIRNPLVNGHVPGLVWILYRTAIQLLTTEFSPLCSSNLKYSPFSFELSPFSSRHVLLNAAFDFRLREQKIMPPPPPPTRVFEAHVHGTLTCQRKWHCYPRTFNSKKPVPIFNGIKFVPAHHPFWPSMIVLSVGFIHPRRFSCLNKFRKYFLGLH